MTWQTAGPRELVLDVWVIGNFLFVCLFSKTGFLCVALEPVLELALWTKLASNSHRSACLCLLSTGIKGVRHHSPDMGKYFKDAF